MDWNLAIERNREALKRVLAMLVAMTGLAVGPHPEPVEGHPELVGGAGEDCSARGGAAEASADPGEGYIHDRHTLSRFRHRAVLRLLRAAESAARRLIIVAAREIVMQLPPSRRAKPKSDPKAAHAALRSLGIAILMSPADIARAAAEKRAAEKRAAARATRALSLPLLDPPRRLLSLSKGRVRPRHVPAHAAPRILSFDGAAPYRLPPPPSPDDRIDATRLTLRLAALAAALDDLPGHARRFALWQARRAQNRNLGAARSRRRWPLRSGRPPGQHPRNSRRPAHEVHEVLADLHWFAFQALKAPDTS